MQDQIVLQGVATNNLKGVTVAFPLDRISVVTGVSGSGKSSLVFDTLYSEAYRRYVESLSSYARQYLKALPKPTLERIENLPPAVAVQQHRAGGNARSTVGTLTELNDLIAVIFTHGSRLVCTACGIPVTRDTPEVIARHMLTRAAGETVTLTAPLEHFAKVKAKDLRELLSGQGFARVVVGGAVVKLADVPAGKLHAAAIVVDRVRIDAEGLARVREGAQVALKAGAGRMAVLMPDGVMHQFSNDLRCTGCGREYREPTVQLFNFNHPLGACHKCQGFGRSQAMDIDKVVPDRAKSLTTEGVSVWNFGRLAVYYRWAAESAKKRGIEPSRPFRQYKTEDWQWLIHGESRGKFDGIVGAFAQLDEKRYKPHYRIHAARFRRYETCSECHGDRLNEQALACVIDNKQISAVRRLSVEELDRWLLGGVVPKPNPDRVASAGNFSVGIEEALDESRARIRYLLKVGLGYLNLERTARTLSGGELQRINMARCLGSALTGTLYCLDEPSAGLHARDSHNLLEVITELKDQGNTVVMVEHERLLIKAADHLVEIGPDAGHRGGQVVYAGVPTQETVARGVGWEYAPALPAGFASFMIISGAATHNLRRVTARFPAGKMTVVCGVSGSGKTSLVRHTLYPLLCSALGQDLEADAEPKADGVGPQLLIKQHSQVVMVSQAALGRSSRSNIATYLGIFTAVREALAATLPAKVKKLTPGHFSFNVAGGRCEACKGLGTVVEDLSFLGEIAIMCSACEGRRFADAVLDVTYRGKNLIDILTLTVAEARELFFDMPAMTTVLDQVISLGLGYLTLGQSTASFSGGEAQRVKLLSLMKEARGTKPAILIFDEPTTGLSDRDVRWLLAQLRGLTDQGNTLIVVEHHLGMIAAADWAVEIGPEAAAGGGALVYEGAPRGMIGVQGSRTAPFLNEAVG